MGVIIPKLKVLGVATILFAWQGLFAQQAPVTRGEFAALFAGVARGYVDDETKALPVDFLRDRVPITKTEVAAALVHLANSAGKVITKDGSPVDVLRVSKLLPEQSTFFENPGQNFRPQDLIRVLVDFAEKFSTERRVQSDHEMALTTPKIKR